MSRAECSTEVEGLALVGISCWPSSESLFPSRGNKSSRRHINCRRQPNLCIPIEQRSSSERVARTLPSMALSRRIFTTSDAIAIDAAQMQTSSQAQSCSLSGKFFAGVGGVNAGPSAASSTARQWNSVSCMQSSTRLGSAVPPVLPSVAPSIGLVGQEAAGDSSKSAAPFPLPTKTQSLLYLSHMLDRPRLSPFPLLADPVDSL